VPEEEEEEEETARRGKKRDRGMTRENERDERKRASG